MGEPNTYMPMMSLSKDEGIIEFEIYSEGMTIKFDMDVDRIGEMVSRLEDLKERYDEDE